MFAYCLNNPVSYVDPSGRYAFWAYPSDYAGWAGSEIGKFFYEQIEDTPLGKTMSKVANSIFQNLEMSCSIGLGLRFGGTILEVLGIDAGISYDLLHVSANHQGFTAEEKFWEGCDATFLWYNISFSDSLHRAFPHGKWEEEPESNTIDLFSASGYLFGGGSLAISFNLNAFMAEIFG